jgi:hypothetical protein
MIYLSGPMTGYPDFNYPAFRKAADVLRTQGLEVFDPSECFDGDQTLLKETYMREDITAVLKATLVVTLDGWEKSSGARLEVEVAKAIGVPVESYNDFIIKLTRKLVEHE